MTQLKHLAAAATLVVMLGVSSAFAQSGHHGHGTHGGAANPYGTLKDRLIKALST